VPRTFNAAYSASRARKGLELHCHFVDHGGPSPQLRLATYRGRHRSSATYVLTKSARRCGRRATLQTQTKLVTSHPG